VMWWNSSIPLGTLPGLAIDAYSSFVYLILVLI